MKQSLRILLTMGMMLTITIALTACGALPSAPPVSNASPTAPQTNTLPPSVDTVVASAVAVPKQQAQMSFVISAPVKEILVKKDDVVKAGQPLMVLSTLDLELAVEEAEWAVHSAQSLFDRAKDPYKKVFDGGKIVYAAGYVEKRHEMEARLQAAQAALDSAKYAFTQGTLLAPFDGTIVEINIVTGEIAQPGKVVITEGDLARMQIETTDLSERDVPTVQIGQTAKVYLEALDTTVTGKVIQISPISETIGGDVVYPVTIELDEQPAGLLWGMSAEVEIQTK
jgi:RND family efflux transporter MFP subunit